jgi:hypothetical protein
MGTPVVRACCRVVIHRCTMQVENLPQAKILLLSLEGED